MADQAKIKDHEKQLVDHGLATYEFDKLPFVIETSGGYIVVKYGYVWINLVSAGSIDTTGIACVAASHAASMLFESIELVVTIATTLAAG